MRSAANSHRLLLKKSRSTNLCENPFTSIVSELLADVGLLQELIIEILLRLPVKSLSKFKCVSKLWLSLISSPHFIRSHFSTSESRADQDVNSHVLFNTHIKQFTLYSAFNEPSPEVSGFELPSWNRGQLLFILGIVNGLVCVIALDDVFFWNPVLRKSKRFPRPNPKGYKCDAYGFGYDEANDDYKVVFVRSDSDTQAEKVMVYSLLTDSWSRIEDFNPGLPFRGFGKYANGKIHWMSSSPVHEWKIVSLDMVGDKFGEVQMPDHGTSVSGCVLGVSRGQLSVLCDYDKRKADLWLMDKYGFHESWSKVVSIPYGTVHPAMPYSMYHVVCILRNGEIVLSDGEDFLVYHSKHKEFRKIEMGGSEEFWILEKDGSVSFEFYVYVESLVSPYGSVGSPYS